jgi:hypothetical protein
MHFRLGLILQSIPSKGFTFKVLKRKRKEATDRSVASFASSLILQVLRPWSASGKSLMLLDLTRLCA